MKTKVMIAVLALALIAGGIYGINDVAACGGKSSNASASASTCGTKANAKLADASGSCEKSCTKEECISYLMAHKNMTKAEAEQAYANCAKTKSSAEAAVMTANATGTSDASCASKCSSKKANATAASARGTCSASKASKASADGCCSKSNATAASASGSCHGKNASAASAKGVAAHSDCVNWLMANKGMTRDEAEMAMKHCEKSQSAAQAGVKLANAEKEATTDAATTNVSGSSN